VTSRDGPVTCDDRTAPTFVTAQAKQAIRGPIAGESSTSVDALAVPGIVSRFAPPGTPVAVG
jgi:hypothetical protein